VLVDDICARFRPGWPAKWRLAALLHDAPEYVIGDMISPFKAVLGDDYKVVEARLARAVHQRFGLPGDIAPAMKKLIKKADLISAWLEATELAGFSHAEADQFFIRPPEGAGEIDMTPLSPSDAQGAFLKRFAEILEELDACRGAA
jgi:5'-deoxynucleotidase YfbR-like HD superfamily hydrolase